MPTDFVTWDGGGIRVKPVDEIDVDRLGAIQELSRNGDRFRVRLHDKLKALELLGKHLGMFGPKPPEVSMGIDRDAETIRARMLARLKQAQQASKNSSEHPPSGSRSPSYPIRKFSRLVTHGGSSTCNAHNGGKKAETCPLQVLPWTSSNRSVIG